MFVEQQTTVFVIYYVIWKNNLNLRVLSNLIRLFWLKQMLTSSFARLARFIWAGAKDVNQTLVPTKQTHREQINGSHGNTYERQCGYFPWSKAG